MIRLALILISASFYVGVYADIHTRPVDIAKPERVFFSSHKQKLAGLLQFPPVDKRNGSAIVIVGPQTSLKEQVSSEYAARLLNDGFVVLTYDPRTFGESSGTPREFENPQWKVEDIHSAVDFLRGRIEIDRERIGVLGVCCGGAYAARAATENPKIKAVALVAGNMLNPETMKVVFGSHYGRLIAMGKTARQKYQKTGRVDYIPNVDPDPKRVDVAMPLPGSYDYYSNFLRDPKSRWKNQTATMYWELFLNFDVLKNARKISAPITMIHSEKALFPSVAKTLYSQIPSKKSEVWINQFDQMDFLKNPTCIDQAAKTAGTFFKKELASKTRQPARGK